MYEHVLFINYTCLEVVFMHNMLFYNYLKVQNSNKQNFLKDLLKTPLSAKLLLLALIVTGFSVFISVYINKTAYFIALLLEIVLCLIVHIYTERFTINNSDIRIEDYINRSKETLAWLKGIGVVVTNENIEDILQRTIKTIEKMENKRSGWINRIEKWIQVILIPVALSIFSYLLDNTSNWENIIYNSVAIVFLVLTIIVVVACFFNVCSFFNKRKIEQYKYFAHDLQGVLDCQLNNKVLKEIEK